MNEGHKMESKILRWFATGRVGASSKTMALAVVDLPHAKDHPYDPDDLNRCLLLLETVPEIRGHMDKIAAVSKVWTKLVARWDELEKCFINEAGLNWTKSSVAPRTYALMKEIGC